MVVPSASFSCSTLSSVGTATWEFNRLLLLAANALSAEKREERTSSPPCAAATPRSATEALRLR
eukprot:11757990-Alexandrium_andersonii.AAC.1